MHRRLACLLPLALAACSSPRYNDVVGPFTGVTYRFVIDGVQLPLQRSDYADDLDGNGHTDNELGSIAGTLAADNDLTTALADLFGSGVLAPVVEITTDDPTLRNDPTVGVRFLGADGEVAGVMGGALVDGRLESNPTRLTADPASATIHLPLFEHADPLVLPAIGLEIALSPDGDGFDGILRGAFPATNLAQLAWPGLAQMLAANPQEFPQLLPDFDLDRDGVVTVDEFANNGLTKNLLAPDLQLTVDGAWSPQVPPNAKDSLSFAFALHLSPCASGRCHAPPADLCQDRVLDGDETGVDCGGSCLACPGGARCTSAADCQSRQCDAGLCAAPSCSDGVLDGGELGVDCGYGCGPCPLGSICRDDGDCGDGAYCAGAFLSNGTCTALLCTDGVRDNDEANIDCGGHCPGCPHGARCTNNSDCASNRCETLCGVGPTCTSTCA